MTGYIGVGSNLGDRRGWLRSGIRGLRAAGVRVTAVSSVWETEPVGVPPTGWFLNLVVRVSSGLRPLDMLDTLLDIERRSGRVRSGRPAPRTLDLDLLLLDDLRWRDDRLVLPHPRMWERRFVLEPLREIAPELRNPASGRSVAEECERIRGRSAARVAGRLPLADIIRPSTPARSGSGDEIQIDRG